MFKYIKKLFSRKSNNTNGLDVVYPRLPSTYPSTYPLTCQFTAVTTNEFYTIPSNYFNYSGSTNIGMINSGVSYYNDILITTQKNMVESKEDIFLKKLEKIKKKTKHIL